LPAVLSTAARARCLAACRAPEMLKRAAFAGSLRVPVNRSLQLGWPSDKITPTFTAIYSHQWHSDHEL
jgi:hypothetical protein